VGESDEKAGGYEGSRGGVAGEHTSARPVTESLPLRKDNWTEHCSVKLASRDGWGEKAGLSEGEGGGVASAFSRKWLVTESLPFRSDNLIFDSLTYLKIADRTLSFW
jgi:hypothetical protein